MESSWNDSFLDENELAYITSDDSDSGPIAVGLGHISSEEEIGTAIIQLTHNQTRRDRLQVGNVTGLQTRMGYSHG